MKELFDGETVVFQSQDKKFIVTSKRVAKDTKELGSSFHQSIMLEHITSCENKRSYMLAYIVLAMIFVVMAIMYNYNGQQNSFMVAGIIGLFFLIMFFATRENIIVISSPTTKIKMSVSSLKMSKALDFINIVEKAICAKK